MARECSTQQSTQQSKNVFIHYSIYSNPHPKTALDSVYKTNPVMIWMSHLCEKGRSSSHHRRALSLGFAWSGASGLQTAHLTQRPLSAGSTCWNTSKGKVSDVGCSAQGPEGATMPRKTRFAPFRLSYLVVYRHWLEQFLAFYWMICKTDRTILKSYQTHVWQGWLW